ncbi:LysR family transcriptional regulator [Pseudomonas sp. LABIM340]|uniref:LysR family transcriptional regulator n=1 Tax=Pseudomonas sp. LABIM340 TaxID=3156585 RepID=UPI0032AFF4AC
MKDFAALSTFRAVAELASMSRAAKLLGVSVSAISQKITGLEKQIGVSLLNRTPKGISLTEAGRIYYETCEQALALLSESEAKLSHYREEMSGRLKIAAAIGTSIAHVSKSIEHLINENPGLHLEIFSKDGFIDLRENQVDFAIRFGPQKDSTLISRKVATWKRILCASPSYLAHRSAITSPEDLKHHDLIVNTAVDPKFFSIDLPLEGSGESLQLPPKHLTNSSLALREMAMLGFGVGRFLLPEVINDIRAGSLCPVLPDQTTDDIDVFILTAGKNLPLKVKAAIDHSRQYFESASLVELAESSA